MTNPAANPKRPAHRPPLYDEPMQRVVVSLPASVVEELRKHPVSVAAAIRERLGLKY